MKRIFEGKKRVFWEALLITVAIFMMGLLSGVAFENNRLDKINDYYAKSEISLIDSLAMKDILISKSHNLSCEKSLEYNRQFADRIYNESLKLAKYEEANKITDNVILAHKKYDALRTILWMSNKELYDRCGNYSYVVYLYNYETQKANEQAENNVWSKILYDLKFKKGSEVVLIPIASNSELASLDALISKYDIKEFPVVIINDKQVVRDLESVEDLESRIEETNRNI